MCVSVCVQLHIKQHFTIITISGQKQLHLLSLSFEIPYEDAASSWQLTSAKRPSTRPAHHARPGKLSHLIGCHPGGGQTRGRQTTGQMTHAVRMRVGGGTRSCCKGKR